MGEMPDAPQPVRTAVTLVWVMLVLDLVGLAVTFSGARVGEVVGQPVGGPPLDPETLRAALVLGAGIGLLLTTGLSVLMALQLRAGRTWPRTVLVVLAGVGTVSLLSPGSAGPVTLTWEVIGLGLQVATVVLLFRPASRAWLGAWKPGRAEARRRRVAW